VSDKRSVATDALETLGTIIDDRAKRDAIHLAVIPAIAGMTGLQPGNPVKLVDGVALWALDDGIGIVDPFLTEGVKKGERFWLVIYPRTINSLRHVWTHPALPDEPELGRAPENSRAESEQWLRNYCDDGGNPPYDYLLRAVKDEHSYGHDYLTIDGRDASGEIPDELWNHLEVVLGKKLHNRPKYFSCSC
jgi:hypothetical protein